MKRIAVFVLLTISVWAVAQTSSANSGSSNPAPQTYVLPAAPGGLSTNTGTAIIVAQPTTPLVVTPEFHLTTVNPSVGASNATPGNNAGAANATTSMPVSPRIVTTVPQFATAGASVTQTLPPQETQSSPAYSGAGGTISGAPVVVVNHGMLFDRGVGSGGSLVAGSSTGESLGEIARQNRQHEATLNAHVYTNNDIDRINSQPATATGGMSGVAVGAGNATQQQPASDSVPAVAQPSSNPPANPGVSQPVPPASTTPPPKEQSQLLPSGGSALPLMTAVGIVATGAGLLAR